MNMPDHFKFFFKTNNRIDRNEFSGSFGDMGTTIPLLIGMINNCNINSTGVFISLGLVQIITGFLYGLPMPVQPLKAMAVIMITRKLSPSILYGAGLAIGITMFLLTVTGILDKLATLIPLCVIRGIQLALGLSLAGLAVKEYIPSGGMAGYILALSGFMIILFFFGNRKYPPALFLLFIGIIYAGLMRVNSLNIGLDLSLPVINIPDINSILQGFLILALPQIPLSISNSIIATKQTITDLFPGKNISAKKIGITYSFMNFINPFLGGIPTCHGAGGLAGYYAFGARTGGAVIITGTIYLLSGFFFGHSLGEIIKLFPLPLLGVILLFESINLMMFARDMFVTKKNLFICLLVALIGYNLPNGYIIGLLTGTVTSWLIDNRIILTWWITENKRYS